MHSVSQRGKDTQKYCLLGEKWLIRLFKNSEDQYRNYVEMLQRLFIKLHIIGTYMQVRHVDKDG